MALFQQSVLNKYLSQQDKPLVDKVYKNKLIDYFSRQDNLKNNKEVIKLEQISVYRIHFRTQQSNKKGRLNTIIQKR